MAPSLLEKITQDLPTKDDSSIHHDTRLYGVQSRPAVVFMRYDLKPKTTSFLCSMT